MRNIVLSALKAFKGFNVEEQNQDIVVSFVKGTQPHKLVVSFDPVLKNGMYVETDSKRYLFQSNSPIVLLKRITDFISSGTVITPVKSSVLPAVLRDAFLYPIGSSSNGLHFKDFNGQTYIFSEEAPVGLSLYKTLYDIGLDQWMTTLPEMYMFGEEPKKVLKASLNTDLSGISELPAYDSIKSRVDIPSFREMYGKSGLPYKPVYAMFESKSGKSSKG